jgi:hypothetical protein
MGIYFPHFSKGGDRGILICFMQKTKNLFPKKLQSLGSQREIKKGFLIY